MRPFLPPSRRGATAARRARSACFGIALLLAAGPAQAQLVRGVVLDSASDEPLAGATVRLVGADGGAVGGALLGENGRFALRAPSPGRYAVHVQRVGWTMTRDTSLDLAAGDTVWRRIVVAAVPVSLAEIRITARRSCDARADSRETLLVWEEARKALDATMLTSGARFIRAAVVDYERELDLRTLAVRKETRDERVGLVDQPYRSRPPESFSHEGYMQDMGGVTWLFAPSAEVLLAPAFVREHCLHLVPGRGARSGMIGLGFDPVESRTVTDIAGVLWLDVGTAELRDLQFRYTGLPDYMPAGKVGGSVEFARLPNGAWVMRRWSVRAPILQRSVQPRLAGTGPGALSAGQDISPQVRMKVLGIREAAGEILWATTTTGAPLLGAPPER
jgi:hypothetical protein